MMGTRAWQPQSPATASAVSARQTVFIGEVLSGWLFQAVLVRVVADDRGREDLRNVLHRLVGQDPQAVEVPEVALLLAPASGLLGEPLEDAHHSVLALVVAGDGQHERIAAELAEQRRQISRGGPG